MYVVCICTCICLSCVFICMCKFTCACIHMHNTHLYEQFQGLESTSGIPTRLGPGCCFLFAHLESSAAIYQGPTQPSSDKMQRAAGLAPCRLIAAEACNKEATLKCLEECGRVFICYALLYKCFWLPSTPGHQTGDRGSLS